MNGSVSSLELRIYKRIKQLILNAPSEVSRKRRLTTIENTISFEYRICSSKSEARVGRRDDAFSLLSQIKNDVLVDSDTRYFAEYAGHLLDGDYAKELFELAESRAAATFSKKEVA